MLGVVTEMHKKRSARSDAFHVGEGLFKRQMHRVGVIAQGIDDERVDPVDDLSHLVTDDARIRDIGEIADFVAENVHESVGN